MELLVSNTEALEVGGEDAIAIIDNFALAPGSSALTPLPLGSGLGFFLISE